MHHETVFNAAMEEKAQQHPIFIYTEGTHQRLGGTTKFR